MRRRNPKIAKNCYFCIFLPFASFHKILKKVAGTMGHYGALSQNRKNCDFCVFWQFCKFPQNPEKGCGHYGHIRTCKLQASTHEMLKYGGTAGTLVPHPTILKLLTKAVCK
jgi:hypothetical protein